MASGADCQIIAQLDTLLVIDPPPHASRMRSNWGKRSQLSSLIDCIGRFNLRWADFLRDVDLSDVNSEVTAYNQYYLFEKECAMRSSRLAAIGYEPARFITQAELAQRYPPLPLPRLNLVRRRRADGAESSNRWRS
jgi:hypothetical protein